VKGNMPVLYCDAEEGCAEWMIDHRAMDVDNWRELVPEGWTYDPYKDAEAALCPYHHPVAVAAREAGYPVFYELLGLKETT
jgi:hypothetical protein